MQQDHVLQALAASCTQVTTSVEVVSDRQTLAYLQSLNKLFECGILSGDKVTSENTAALTSMKEGFRFFEQWCEDTITAGIDPGSQTQKTFLAWQVYIIHTVEPLEPHKVSLIGVLIYFRD